MSVANPQTTKSGKKKQLTAYEQYLAANPEMAGFVTGSGAMPETATREEQDVAKIYQSAYANEQAINSRADAAVLDANKAHDLSMKYLAAQNQANGLGGLGISDTSSLRLSSQYQKALSDVNATRENALQENYSKMQDDVQTVRGEWASQKEAKKQSAGEYISGLKNSSSVDAYLKAIGFEEGSSEYSELMAQWKTGYDSYVSDVIMGYDDRTAVDRYLAANGVQKGTEQYDSYMSQWELAYGENDSSMESGEIVLPQNTSYNNNGKFLFFGQDDFREGDNFSIKVGNKILRVQSGGAVEDANIIKAAKNVGNNQIFGYNEKVYYKVNGQIYLVERRDSSYKKDFDELYRSVYA